MWTETRYQGSALAHTSVYRCCPESQHLSIYTCYNWRPAVSFGVGPLLEAAAHDLFKQADIHLVACKVEVMHIQTGQHQPLLTNTAERKVCFHSMQRQETLAKLLL